MLSSTMLPGERATIAIIGGSNYATLNFWCCSCHFSISNIPHKKSRIGASKSSAFIKFNLWNASLSENSDSNSDVSLPLSSSFSIEFAGLSDPLEIQGGTPHSIFRSDAQRSVKQKERKKQELERQVFQSIEFKNKTGPWAAVFLIKIVPNKVDHRWQT